MNKKQYSSPILQTIPADNADMICVSAAFDPNNTTNIMHAKKKEMLKEFDDEDMFSTREDNGFISSDSIL